jgi:hypothetical protein
VRNFDPSARANHRYFRSGFSLIVPLASYDYAFVVAQVVLASSLLGHHSSRIHYHYLGGPSPH